MRRVLESLLLTLLASPAFAQPAPLSGLDVFIRKAMADWSVPGVAIAIVKDDRILYLKGFGVRRLGHGEPVDADTLFPIGSATKALTATALAVLVDEEKVRWDAPVSAYLRDVGFPSAALTTGVTVRDILSHRTGLADDFPAYWGTALVPMDLLRRFPMLAIHAGLRESFEYNNLMYLAGGEVVSRTSGSSWAIFVRDRLLQPLGMAATAPTKEYAPQSANRSAGHSRDAGGPVHEVPLVDLTNIAPAGSIVSNVVDMAQWVRFQLGDGTFQGRPLVKTKTLAETHSPQIFISKQSSLAPFFADNVFSAYDLGWMSSDYHGHLIVQHPGSTDAIASVVGLMPDQRAGLVVLTNLSNQWLPSAVMYRVFDAFLDNASRDWSAEYLKRTK